jgi:PncC family amidohydrolase
VSRNPPPNSDAAVPAIAGELGAALAARHLTLVTAESCTGGTVAAWLTSVPGSSAYYLGGVVTYANRAKVALLGVEQGTLREHGAVSAEVACQMAAGARRRLGADLAVSVTGIAGPGGGTAEKPVGLVYIGLATAAGVEARRHQFAGTRGQVRWAAAAAALTIVRDAVGMADAGSGGGRGGAEGRHCTDHAD